MYYCSKTVIFYLIHQLFLKHFVVICLYIKYLLIYINKTVQLIKIVYNELVKRIVLIFKKHKLLRRRLKRSIKVLIK